MSNVYAYTALILVLLTFGMETGFFRFANKSDEDAQKVYANSLLFVGGLSLLFVVLCMAFLHPLSALLEYPDHPDYIAMMVCMVALWSSSVLLTVCVISLRVSVMVVCISAISSFS